MEPIDPQGGPAAPIPAAIETPTVTTVVGEVPLPPTPSEATWADGAPTEPVDGGGAVPPAPKRSRTRLMLIGAGILVVGGIVIGIVVASGGGEKPVAAVGPSVTSPPAPSPSPSVPPPVGFTAKGQTVPFGVALTWSEPFGQSVQGYRIFRAGVQIAAVPSGTTTYLDSNVAPGKTYTYDILTRGEGLFQSNKVSADVKVPVPSLSSARLDGTFNVKFKTTSQFGYVGSLGNFTLGWRFTPKCKQGACNVTLKDLSIKDLKTTLTRGGVNYSGKDSAKFLGSCGGVAQTSSLTIDLHVVKGGIINGEWHATKLVGTVVESHPSAMGCTSGGAHFSITATITG